VGAMEAATMVERPAELQANMWTGEVSPIGTTPQDSTWRMSPQPKIRDGRDADATFAPPPIVDLRDWSNPEVGWGLILPDTEQLNAKDKAVAADAPKPLQNLLHKRGDAPVLRWSSKVRPGHLVRYYRDGTCHERPMAAAEFGTGPGKIPRYLLIYATPKEIPWTIQYQLNLTNYVGRLTLVGDALDIYVSHLLTDWAGEPVSKRPVIWSVDDGALDITGLMARAVGKCLADAFAADADYKERTWLTGSQATCAKLAGALVDRTPGLICTTSHGMTGPLRDPALLRAQLGAPIDARKVPLTVADLKGWAPAGAIWYAHACCSAGSDAQTRYEGLFGPADPLGTMLRNVASVVGECVAPIAEQLLGHPRPLRAFVGHVEPTFDWTLRDPISRQVLAHTIVHCLYNRLHQGDRPSPIGWALQDNFLESARFYGVYQTVRAKAQAGIAQPTDVDPLYQQLVAMDRQTLVILGDPTVAISQTSCA
jgi:hypothetical protein